MSDYDNGYDEGYQAGREVGQARIEELEAKMAACEKYRDAYAEMGRIGTEAVRDLEAKLAKANANHEHFEREWYLAKDRIEELEAERDDYAVKWAEANNTYSEMHVAMSEANDKLAKSVEALEKCEIMLRDRGLIEMADEARTTLAELKGDT